MAIRIDLLPRYVGLRRIFKRIIVACLALFAAFASVLFVLWYRGEQELKTLKANEAAFKVIADRADKALADAETREKDAVPYKAVVDFIVDASKTGSERAALLDQVKDYVYRGAVINSLDLSDPQGKSVKFTGMVRTIDDYWRFVLALRQGSSANGGPLFSDLPGGPGVPSFPNIVQVPATPDGAPGTLVLQQFPLGVSSAGTLQNPIVIPAEPGGGAPAAGGAGPPGMPGGGGPPGAAGAGGPPGGGRPGGP